MMKMSDNRISKTAIFIAVILSLKGGPIYVKL